MSNTLVIRTMKFTDSDDITSYGFTASDDYAKSYDDTYETPVNDYFENEQELIDHVLSLTEFECDEDCYSSIVVYGF